LEAATDVETRIDMPEGARSSIKGLKVNGLSLWEIFWIVFMELALHVIPVLALSGGLAYALAPWGFPAIVFNGSVLLWHSLYEAFRRKATDS
jgi:hypothetical protein